MIGISKLYCGSVEAADALRYQSGDGPTPAHLLQFRKEKKPVVVWNITRRCNLRCVHCYSESADIDYGGELTTEEGLAFIDDLAAFGAPVLLFSGGEPLIRPDLLTLVTHASSRGLRAVISTNGTLIDEEKAQRLKEAGVAYAGISLDGIGEVNDRFRRVPGAFDRAMNGVRACLKAGLKVGLRFTITRHNVTDVDGIFDIIEKEGIPRACFYHLVYAGRGSKLVEEDLSHEESRKVLDLIIDRTARLYADGKKPEILTVDNHTDGPALYLRMVREGSERAEEVLKLLRMNGGNSTGEGIGCVGFTGDVHPDQFWRYTVLGNVREKPFSEIWGDSGHELLGQLRNRKALLKGRCAECRFLDVCNGNFRVRAEAVTGDLWGPDPACFLTDAEIGIAP
jgi:12,18-didecarboxysiroheme deacetylase